MKYKDPNTGEFKEIYVKVGDNIPVGTEVDYDGNTIPTGWQQVADPNEYSTDEKRIGTWIDGKPIYRKVIDCGYLTNNTGKEINLNISNINTIIKCFGSMQSSTDYSILPSPSSASASIVDMWIDSNLTKLHIQTHNNRTSFTAFAIIEYTKTTD